MAQDEGSSIVPEITCQEITQWVSAYLDEQVGERKHQIALHLAVCAGCETYVRQIAMVRDMVALLPKALEQPSDLHRLRQTFAARGRRLPPSGD